MKSIPPVKNDEVDDDWERELTDREVGLRMHRVSGECICDICGNEYWKHPMETRIPSGVDDRPFLHRLCNGWFGKL